MYLLGYFWIVSSKIVLSTSCINNVKGKKPITQSKSAKIEKCSRYVTLTDNKIPATSVFSLHCVINFNPHPPTLTYLIIEWSLYSQKHSPDSVLQKSYAKKFNQILRKMSVPELPLKVVAWTATFYKKDTSAEVLSCNLPNFSKHLFHRTSENCYLFTFAFSPYSSVWVLVLIYGHA